jgi:hypothetical protein
VKTTKTTKEDKDKALREHVVYLLEGGGAHAKFDEVVADVPPKILGQKPVGLPHSLWMLLEHLRIAQWDILEFSRNSKHTSPKWPEGYWPKTEAPSTAAAWNASVKKFRQGLQAMQELVKDPKTDLFGRIPWGDGQTILREALLLADHKRLSSGTDVGRTPSARSLAEQVNVKLATNSRG